jgi:hypothetical protein
VDLTVRMGSNPIPGAILFFCCSCGFLLSTSTSVGLCWFLCFVVGVCFGLGFGCVGLGGLEKQFGCFCYVTLRFWGWVRLI